MNLPSSRNTVLHHFHLSVKGCLLVRILSVPEILNLFKMCGQNPRETDCSFALNLMFEITRNGTVISCRMGIHLLCKCQTGISGNLSVTSF